MSGILYLVLGLSVTTLAHAAAQPTVLATFNTQLAIQSVEEGKKAHALLKKELDEQKKKIETAGKKVQAAYEEYQKQAMVLDEKARRDREEKIQNDMMEVRKMEQEAQSKFAKRDQEVSQPISRAVRRGFSRPCAANRSPPIPSKSTGPRCFSS